MSDIDLTTWRLDPKGPLRRLPPRPLAQRPPGYLQQFDAHTLVYDLFREPDGPRAVAIVPPPVSLRHLVASMTTFTDGGRTKRPPSLIERDRTAEIWIAAAAADTHVRLSEPALGTVDLPIQPSGVDAFAGLRVLTTLSRNNELRWIADWARFHHRAHGVEAFLLYDNASDRYAPAEVAETLRTAAPQTLVRVVSWPFKFGPSGMQHNVWDSDFCQYASLSHARWRFLARARSVLNVDIDEFVVSPQRESIFAAAEAHPLGYIAFAGCWIAYCPPTAPIHHGAFRWRDRALSMPATKWCTVPARCSFEQQWCVHNITGHDLAAVPEERFLYRHFWAINTSWKYNRGRAAEFDPSRHEADEVLAAQMDAFLVSAP